MNYKIFHQRYQHQLGIILAKIEKLDAASKHPDLGLVGEGLITLMDQKLSQLDNRLYELSSKITVANSQTQEVDEQKPKEANKQANKPEPGGFGGDGNGNGNDNSNSNANGNKNNENFQEELAPVFNDMGGGPVPPNPDFTSGTTAPPMDMPIYNDMMQDVRGDLKNSYKRGNQSQPWNIGDYNA